MPVPSEAQLQRGQAHRADRGRGGHSNGSFIRWAVAGNNARAGLKPATAPAASSKGSMTPKDDGRTPAASSTKKPSRSPTRSPGCWYRGCTWWARYGYDLTTRSDFPVLMTMRDLVPGWQSSHSVHVMDMVRRVIVFQGSGKVVRRLAMTLGPLAVQACERSSSKSMSRT